MRPIIRQSLGGKLPTPQQWDKAGGRFDKQDGPFQGSAAKWDPGDLALCRSPQKPRDARPLPVGKAVRDISFFKCRDMASNGLEWTRYVPPDQEVNLRGKSYRSFQPFIFKRDADIDQAAVQTANDEISFRVVLELPIEP
jgi:hypothetical protein